MSAFYNFIVKDIDGTDYPFKELKGKVVLIVNVASKCGFTPQYEGLQKLYETYKDKGLEILGFPSNDFLFQELASNNEIKNFCLLNYGVDFHMFEKIHVRGSKSHELYKYLTRDNENKEFKGSVKWNFTKFLFDRSGKMIGRYSPATKQEEIEGEIVKLL